MSIYIKGMQTPVAGQCIEFAENLNGDLYARLSPSFDDWHEVVSLPAHGRLVDADRLAETMDDRYSLGEIGRREHDDVVGALRYNAPTVIPKEEV